MAVLLVYLLGVVVTAVVICVIDELDGVGPDAATAAVAALFGVIWPLTVPLMALAAFALLVGRGIARLLGGAR